MNSSTQKPPGAIRVLVLEDEPLVLMLIEALLREFGYTDICSAQNLGAARSATDRALINVALLDIRLPGGNSFEFAAELQERGIPLIFASAGAASEIPERFSDAPLIDKPFDPNELRSALQHVLRGAALTQGLDLSSGRNTVALQF